MFWPALDLKNTLIWLAGLVFAYYICNPFAGIAQLVEHDLAKVGVAGPSPVSRSREEKGIRKDALFYAKQQYPEWYISVCPFWVGMNDPFSLYEIIIHLNQWLWKAFLKQIKAFCLNLHSSTARMAVPKAERWATAIPEQVATGQHELSLRDGSNSLLNARMAELVDALDLKSSGQ